MIATNTKNLNANFRNQKYDLFNFENLWIFVDNADEKKKRFNYKV